MKKVLVGITAAACAAVMCVGLVACGSGANAKDVKSIEVTEEQWTAAFEYFRADDIQFSVESTQTTTQKAGGQTATATTTLSFRIKDQKTYGKMESKVSGAGATDEGNGVEEEYSAYENDVFCVYSKGEDGKWKKTENGTSTFVSMLSSLVYGPNFADFEYNADEKGYVAKTTTSGLPVTVYKFGKVGDDVRLVAIYMHSEAKVETVEATYEGHYVLNYNNVADINLPSVG